MKSKKLKRILALVLCMALLLSTGLSALASTEGATETPVPESIESQEPAVASTEDTTAEGLGQEPSNSPDVTDGKGDLEGDEDLEGGEPQAENESQGGDVPAENNTMMGVQSAPVNDLGIQPLAAYNFYDLNGGQLSVTQYNGMLGKMEDKLNQSDVTITNWMRSGTPLNISKLNSRYNWTWDTVKNISLNLNTPQDVWDGSRLNKDEEVEHYYKDYIDHYYKNGRKMYRDTISANKGELYDSATWKFTGSNNQASMYRFRGEFNIGNINPNEYSFTLSPVTGEDRIYINDDIYVFVYPKDATLTNNNFMNYLAFWTGTVSQYGDVKFHDRAPTTSVHDTNDRENGFKKLTDGWYLSAVEDNAANAIMNAYNEKGTTEFYVDVFTDDYAGGGGMYRLQMETNPVRKIPVSFTKVDVDDSSVVVPGAKFNLDADGIHYSAISDSDGQVQFNVVPGIYTMTEVAPENYEQPKDSWTVSVSSNGNYTIRWNGSGNNVTGSQGSYAISNKCTARGSFSVKKVNSSGVGLPGAEFTLSSGNEVVQTVSSGDDGIVNFTDLDVGTYTLKETKAPDGYVPEEDSWTVKIEKDGSGLQVVLYDAEGETEKIPDADGTYHIVNYTPGELIERSLENDKRVSLLDWDERTYKIELSASSKMTQTTTVTTPYDIVMVLDVSGSMGDSFYNYSEHTGNLAKNTAYYIKTASGIYQLLNRKSNTTATYKDTYTNKDVTVQTGQATIYTRQSNNDSSKRDALKGAAKEFIQTVKEKNPDSRIGIVTFAGTANIKQSSGKYMLRVGDSSAQLVEWIDDLGANGATNSEDGMLKAKDVFDSDSKYWAEVTQSTARKKMVVFLTDGVPTTSSNFSSNVANNAVNNANNIKSNHQADIYSLGIFDAATNAGSINNGTIKKIDDYMRGVASADTNYMTADSVASLSGLFDSITSSMSVTLKGTITDVIDSRFELTTGQREQLEAGGASVTVNKDGTTTITWADVDIQSAKGDKPGWSKEIIIKAKDDFIGGNMVPTNGASSGIILEEGGSKSFPQPSVNVKLLDLDLIGNMITIYKGDKINPSSFAGELAESLTVVQIDNKMTMTGVPVLTTEQIAALLNSETIGSDQSIRYTYPNTTDPVGYFVYTYGVAENESGSMEEHEASTVGNKAEVYALKVQYIPYTTDERNEMLSGINAPTSVGGAELELIPTKDCLKQEAEYIVNIIAGEIQITKKLDKALDTEQTFTFKVEKDGERFKDITITVPANQTEVSFLADDLKELSRGEYVITELDKAGYAVKELAIHTDTNCENSMKDETVTFMLGNNKGGKDVIAENDYTNGILGKVTYTNEEVIKDWEIVKRSSSSEDFFLEGAIFKLEPGKGDGTVYFGKSEADGKVAWYSDEECNTPITGTIAADTYTLTEIKAPVGYSLSTEKWTIEVSKKGMLKSITSSKDGALTGAVNQGQTTVRFYYDNTALYELPSTGGPGIFWYMIGGVLLMMAGVLILYKNKYREVLKNK